MVDFIRRKLVIQSQRERERERELVVELNVFVVATVT